MRIIMVLAAALLASAMTVPSRAADCSKLQIMGDVQMTRTKGGADLIPVKINGKDAQLYFETAQWLTVLSRKLVDDLKLPTFHGNVHMYDSMGNVSNESASIQQFIFADMQAKDVRFAISPSSEWSYGELGTNYLTPFDVDVDFGTDRMKLFSPDHCPGGVVYWADPASVAVVPMTLRSNAVTVPVTVDGRRLTAVIDSTGSTEMWQEQAENIFGLTMGSADTPPLEGVTVPQGKEQKQVYTHTFKTIAFGDITINNARVRIVPYVFSKVGDTNQQTGNRARLNNQLFSSPEIYIGINVLRKLHVYFAFHEDKMYISPATPEQASAVSPPDK
ncbi:MAG TPA: aspartyl protease family protein [Rhizomicrobium sp.]|nr:aspartyl protease family protein [Rhizomicrobium sp.]